ncbi:hypothetical protein ACIBG0_36935 [Nocardia sp. NPDC050630]|uniref:hypothetical protein n=1 Tax=Nocardia sp. NPDC050630 TaxID=3364321 RepID=UPI0037B506C7
MMLTLEIKLNRLFQLRHDYGQPERTTDDVARAVSRRIGTAVRGAMLSEARSGQLTNLPVEIAEGLSAEFGVDPIYLTNDEGPEVKQIDLFIQIFILLRDRGLHIAGRGFSSYDLDTLEQILEVLKEPTSEETASVRNTA